ncbi:MAG: hypothetical protein HY696_02820 [Deltaproteobacteria bacterium]|nr:hypothetical protein [Deltaproteobacteria bacterium]
MRHVVKGMLIALASAMMPAVGLTQVASSYETPIGSAAEAKPISGYDGSGFFLRSADDDFSLQIASRLQFQHIYTDVRAAGAADANTFRMRRARVTILGKLFKNFEFMNLINYGTVAASTTAVTGGGGGTVPNPNPPTWLADMTATVIPQFKIQVGTVTLPLSRIGERSSGKQAFVELPITATQVDGGQLGTIARQAFDADTTLGLRLLGDIGKFHYIVGVGNGEDSNYYNVTRSFSYGGRVWFDILGDSGGNGESDYGYTEEPVLSVGAGSLFDPQDATDSLARTLDWSYTGSGDLYFQWRGLTITGEAYLRKIRVIQGSFTLDDFGYYAQAGYFVIPKKLEIVARGAQIFREGPDNNAYEFVGGLNWHLHGNNVKLQADFSRVLDYDATIGTGGLATNRFRTMFTFNI